MTIARPSSANYDFAWNVSKYIMLIAQVFAISIVG